MHFLIIPFLRLIRPAHAIFAFEGCSCKVCVPIFPVALICILVGDEKAKLANAQSARVMSNETSPMHATCTPKTICDVSQTT
eukprot:4249685-Pyramimonas_sp.AAC.1